MCRARVGVGALIALWKHTDAQPMRETLYIACIARRLGERERERAGSREQGGERRPVHAVMASSWVGVGGGGGGCSSYLEPRTKERYAVHTKETTCLRQRHERPRGRVSDMRRPAALALAVCGYGGGECGVRRPGGLRLEG